jgi:hypothetical protein
MIKLICILLLLAQIQSGTSFKTEAWRQPPTPCQPSELTKYDAEVLLYVLPASVNVRHAGGKEGWEEQTSSALNHRDFFVFYVYDLSTPDSASPTVGYFAINKHTAEVWDIGAKEFLQSEDLLAIQRILRHGHCVDDKTLKVYTSRRPEAPGK